MTIRLGADIARTHAAMQKRVGALPQGEWSNTLDTEDIDAPVRLAAMVRHVIGHLTSDLAMGTLVQAPPGRSPSKGAAALWTIHMSVPPVADGMDERPRLDGPSATAFPSGVMTMPIEATKQVGPVTFCRKKLRPDSGLDGEYPGLFGHILEICSLQGHELDFSAIFNHVNHAAGRRDGDKDGPAGIVALDDSAQLNPKGWQSLPAGRKLLLHLPGGRGYGNPARRNSQARDRDLSKGHLTR